MNTARVIVMTAAVGTLGVTLGGSSGLQAQPPFVRSSGTQAASNDVSSTVVASALARNGHLVLLVLWRGSPAWLAGGRGNSSGGGGGGGHTRLQLTFGGLSFDVDVDDIADVARVLGQQISLKDANVVLVDNVDSKPTIVRIKLVDATVPESADAAWVVLKREPELLEFLQCDLMLSNPMLKNMRSDYLKMWMTVHPCGQVIKP